MINNEAFGGFVVSKNAASGLPQYPYIAPLGTIRFR